MATPPVFTALPRTAWARMSTGTKMFLILTVALLPLGLIALFASIQSAHAKRLQREADTRVIATAEARQIDLLILRGANALRAAVANGATDRARCLPLLATGVDSFRAPVRLAVFAANGRLLCATPGFAARHLPPPRGQIGIDLLLLDRPEALRFTAMTADGSYGVGELPVDLLRRAMPSGDGRHGVTLMQGNTRLALFAPTRSYPLGENLTVGAPVSGGQVNLALSAVTSAISAVEILLVLLPLLMWGAAAAIGWIVVNQLLLRPLSQLQRTIADYGPGRPFALPPLSTPSREILELGESFRATAEQLAEHEAALELGLARQVKLTREVHHRVKNNLQVVASLINLHSRGTEGAVANAYASIQRRVDALAVVHRNHFAELEDNRGIALRALAAELAANLRGTAPPQAQNMPITLDIAPGSISQDTAVPVAFLITELIELVMTCNPGGGVTIALGPQVDGRALLSIEAPGLGADACLSHPGHGQFDRVVTGLSRQLRAPLAYDAARGRYAIEIPLMPRDAKKSPE